MQALNTDLTILVVDDDPGVVSHIKMTLEDHFGPQLKIIGAGTVKKGFKAYFSLNPDIVLLDVHFPEDDEGGIKLLKRIKNVPAAAFVPIILLSDRDTINDQLEELDDKFYPDDFLAKPIPEIELVAKIKQWDRTLNAERNLIMQKDQLAKRARMLARQHLDALHKLSEQHTVATLGLFTRGLLMLFSETLSSICGYSTLMKKIREQGNLSSDVYGNLAGLIQKHSELPREVINSLHIYFETPDGEQRDENIVPILNGLFKLAEHELKKSGLEIESDLTAVPNCIFLPPQFIQAVISILLFFRDEALPSSVLCVSTRQAGSSIETVFLCRVSKEQSAIAQKIVLKKTLKGRIEAFPSSPSAFSLKAAIEAVRGMDGGIDIEEIDGKLKISLILSTNIQKEKGTPA